ncbi:hypothetical protein BDV06DRAFT_38447 [Aspergillus oleicola]
MSEWLQKEFRLLLLGFALYERVHERLACPPVLLPAALFLAARKALVTGPGRLQLFPLHTLSSSLMPLTSSYESRLDKTTSISTFRSNPNVSPLSFHGEKGRQLPLDSWTRAVIRSPVRG